MPLLPCLDRDPSVLQRCSYPYHKVHGQAHPKNWLCPPKTLVSAKPKAVDATLIPQADPACPPRLTTITLPLPGCSARGDMQWV